jgi:polyphosphate kinase 2
MTVQEIAKMADNPEDFDLDNPKLPKAIKRAALGSGGYPYDEKMDSEAYEAELLAAHQQLALFQEHLARNGNRVVIVFEGRDAAGKGGAIRTYLENLNPRFNISVALPKPNDRERTQWYFQRYVDWMPAAGEQVLLDRSWYNRAGVEPVMGFCTPEQTAQFLRDVPHFENQLVDDGIQLFKFWLTIGKEMQLKRFHDRKHDLLKRWKLSPIDLEALPRFEAYTKARNSMLEATSTKTAPWTIILGNDKKRARVNIIRSVLHRLDYDGKDPSAIGEVDGNIVQTPEDFLEQYRDT